MAMVVKNNMSAVNTLNTLNKNTSALQKSLAKVSSGMKINSAQDDASGYAISERMRVMISSLDQANQNTQNGSSLMKVAEGAVANTIEIIKTLKQKAIDAATDTNTDDDRATIQKEIDQFVDQIDDNALVTYNGKYLVDGSKVQAGQATYTAFTNQQLREDTEGSTKLVDLYNRKGEKLEILSTDRITASYVKNGQTFVTTFQVSETTLQGIFTVLETLEDGTQFADYTNPSVIGAIGTTAESSVSGSSNGYTYAQLAAAKAAADAKVEELTAQLEDAQGALGRNSVNGSGWSTQGTVDGTLDAAKTITDTSLVNGAAGALAAALEKVSVLRADSNLFFEDKSDIGDFKNDVTTYGGSGSVNAFAVTAGDGSDEDNSNWDGNSAYMAKGTSNVLTAVQNTLTALDARLAVSDSNWGTVSATNSSRANVQAARDELQTAYDNYKNALQTRDDLKTELDEAKTLQQALTDNVNAIEYKNQAEELETDVYTAIRAQLELAANPSNDTATARLQATDWVGVRDTSSNANTAAQSLSADFSLIQFYPADSNQSTAEFSEALDKLASTITDQLTTYIEQNANADGDAAAIMAAFLSNFGSVPNAATAPDSVPSGDWAAGTGGSWGDLSGLLDYSSITDTTVLSAANWSATANTTTGAGTTQDLAEYGATYDKYLEAKTAAASETAELARAMQEFGDSSSSGNIAVISSKNVGLNTANAVVETPDGKVGLTVTAANEGLSGQISGISISVADAQGNVRKSINTSLNAWKVSIFASNEATEDTSLKIHIGSAANQSIAVDLKDMRAEALGLKGNDGRVVSVATQDLANAAIAAFDNALQKALDQQTTIGAIEARLEYTASNLTTASENVQASESTIRDADMAKEMTNYTKNNVLLQAAQSMLAQANQNSSAVLSLLQ